MSSLFLLLALGVFASGCLRSEFSLPAGAKKAKNSISGSTSVATSISNYIVSLFTPDTSFDGDGLAVDLFESTPETLAGIGVQSTGSIVTVGYAYSASQGGVQTAFAARFTAAGAVDTTFGTNGVFKVTAISPFQVYDMAIGSDDSIYMTGYYGTIGVEMTSVVVKLTPDGAMDTSFNGTGIVSFNYAVGAGYETFTSIAIDPVSGMLYLGGLEMTTNNYIIASLISSTGAANPIWNAGSPVMALVAGYTACAGHNYVKVTVSGSVHFATSCTLPQADSVLLRYTSTGALDAAFGTGGKKVLDGPAVNAYVWGLVVDSSENSYLALRDVTANSTRVLKINSVGVGVTQRTINTDSSYLETAMALDSTETYLYIASEHSVSNNSQIYKVTTAGLGFDVTFDGDGTLDATFSTVIDRVYGLVTRSDGSIITASAATVAGVEIVIEKFDGTGARVTSFGKNGAAVGESFVMDYPSTSSVDGMAVDANGKIYATSNTSCVATVTRFKTDGSRDSTFYYDGRRGYTFGTQIPGSNCYSANAVLPLSSGKILVAGEATIGGVNNVLIFKLNDDSSLDTSFGGGDGVVSYSLSAGGEYTYDMILTSDSKVMLTGSSNTTDTYIMKIDPTTGAIDTTFAAPTGYVTRTLGANTWTLKVIEASSGKFMLAGMTQNVTWDGFVLSYNADGTDNAAFNGSGLLTVEFGGGGGLDSMGAIAEDSTGKFYLFGSSDLSGMNQPYLTKIDATGAVDLTFATAGERVINEFGGNDRANYRGLAIQSDGKLLITGSTDAPGLGAYDDLYFMRLNADGTADTSVGSGTGYTTNHYGITNGSFTGNRIVQNGGAFYVGGRLDGAYSSGVEFIAKFQ